MKETEIPKEDKNNRKTYPKREEKVVVTGSPIEDIKNNPVTEKVISDVVKDNLGKQKNITLTESDIETFAEKIAKTILKVFETIPDDKQEVKTQEPTKPQVIEAPQEVKDKPKSTGIFGFSR